MRICKVWDAEYPWDVRVEKVCRALTRAGHEVHLTARNRRGDPVRKQLPEATVHRMPPWRWLGERLDAASQFPAFFNPRWYRLIKRTAQSSDADVLLCRDLPLAPTSYWVAETLSIPVVLDMAENYPAMIRDLWTTGTNNISDIAVRNPKLVELVEKWTLPRMDHIIVVVEESRDRLLDLGVPEDRITLVSNTPPLNKVEKLYAVDGTSESTTDDDDKPDSEDQHLDVVYLGLMEEARGISLLIDAVAMCRKRDVPIRLSLIGDGQDLEEFKARARKAGLQSAHVNFHGYVENTEALRMVARSDVGVIPHYANESWNTTIPNKLFDYMAAGIPVVASDVQPVRRVLEETGAGIVFEDRNAPNLAAALERVYRAGEEQRQQMGGAGQTAVQERYNWRNDSGRLISAIEALGD